MNDVTVIAAKDAPAARLRAHKAWIATVTAAADLDTNTKWFLAIDCGRKWYWPAVNREVA